MLRSLLLVLLGLACFVPRAAGAQSPDSIPIGSRVRVWVSDPLGVGPHASSQQVRGTLRFLSRDSLVVQVHPDASPFSIRWGAVRRLDESEGRKSRLETALGGALGLAFLGAVEWALLDSIAEDPMFDSGWEAAGVGALVGAGVGSVIGVFRVEEKWETVRLWR
jgi:hypothetical protein